MDFSKILATIKQARKDNRKGFFRFDFTPDANAKKRIDSFLSIDKKEYEDASADHLHDLREKLLEKGYIKSISQKCVYTDEAKQFCLEWYADRLAEQDEKGSTGSWGKWFEVYARVMYAINRGQPFTIADCKCRPCGLRDMFIKADGGTYAVEIKTGAGAVGYGCDKISALESRERFFRKNPILVWDFEANGEPLCMRAYDLLALLESYNPKKGLETWFFHCPNYTVFGKKLNRAYQIQFSISGNKKINFLRELKNSPYNYSWDNLIKYAEFTTENNESNDDE